MGEDKPWTDSCRTPGSARMPFAASFLAKKQVAVSEQGLVEEGSRPRDVQNGPRAAGGGQSSLSSLGCEVFLQSWGVSVEHGQRP